jgi:hypothetical protein
MEFSNSKTAASKALHRITIRSIAKISKLFPGLLQRRALPHANLIVISPSQLRNFCLTTEGIKQWPNCIQHNAAETVKGPLSSYVLTSFWSALTVFKGIFDCDFVLYFYLAIGLNARKVI